MLPSSRLAAAVLAALVVPAAVSAQTPATGEARTLNTVTVTGSNIRRAEAEGSNPVQVIDAEELATSGKITVADVLRSISANTGNATNETSNSGWASGSAGIGLRGLSQKNTLVLLAALAPQHAVVDLRRLIADDQPLPEPAPDWQAWRVATRIVRPVASKATAAVR